jgi:hypothetical protein
MGHGSATMGPVPPPPPWATLAPPWMTLAPPWTTLAPPWTTPWVTILARYKSHSVYNVQSTCPMSHFENDRNSNGKCSSALQLGPHKKMYAFSLCHSAPCSQGQTLFFRCNTDPLVHYSHHFSWTVHALCNVQALLTNGILQMVELVNTPEENFTTEYGCPLTSYVCSCLLQRTTRTCHIPRASEDYPQPRRASHEWFR